MKFKCLLLCLMVAFTLPVVAQQKPVRRIINFDQNWLFNLGDINNGQDNALDDSKWRALNLPHDWSIEGEFSKDNPASPEGGALPGGIGWYRKTFTLPNADKSKLVYISFDGVYQRSDVWINGHHLGYRPNGYISFQYNLTPYLNYGDQKNIIAVKVDNSQQPNSRWYSGSGIYRNVWLTTVSKIAVNHWGTFVTTPVVSKQSATVNLKTSIKNLSGKPQQVNVITTIYNSSGLAITTVTLPNITVQDTLATVNQVLTVNNPVLWSVGKPYLYKIVTKITNSGVVADTYETPLGIRYFKFDADKGFFLNGKPLKILGVCDHHDLGSLGAAVNTRAIERQLEILKAMGCNAIRTSHNPPAPELLDLTDKMGFIVMDEAFDCWQKGKKKFDYHLFFDEWHKRDLEDQILRDRNHPSVVMWSIGNEIPQQTDTSGFRLARELAAIVHTLDTTRPITAANNDPGTKNQIIQSGAVDLVGYNYHSNELANFHDRYPGKVFIGSETTSALETRGVYDMPSDSIRRWTNSKPNRKAVKMNDDYTVSAYDNVSAPWGSTHEEAWKVIKKYDFLSGMFIWTGFDYLGEPTPYTWPARSSYFGIVDLAGFPKDVYYMYQSEWTKTPVLHLLPHWNWEPGKMVDVWAYYNNADNVELFLNGKSLGVKSKKGDDLHVMWHVKYQPGTLKAVSHDKKGQIVLTSEVKTAGPPSKIELTADRKIINADGSDLSFITVKILDKDGNLVPDADNTINFKINGEAFLAGVDNGDPINHDSFKANWRKAFHGLALAIIQAKQKAGYVTFTATSNGLQTASVQIELRN